MNHTEELREELNKEWVKFRRGRFNNLGSILGRRQLTDQILSLLHKLNYQKVIYQDEEFVTTAKFKETHCEPIEVNDD